jgi:hypothetical protein
MARRYIPDHITQADGSPSQWKNCWAAAGAWMADGASRGRKRVKPEVFRKKAKKPRNTTGGLADIARGLTTMKLWDQGKYLNDLTRRQMKTRFSARGSKIYTAESDFAAYPELKKCQPGFNGYHGIGIVPGFGPKSKKRANKVRVMNPLCKNKFTWVNVDRVIDAIISYNNKHSGEKKNTADLIVVDVPKE